MFSDYAAKEQAMKISDENKRALQAMRMPPIEEILVVTPEIEALLGKTADQIRSMTIRELADAAFERGFEWRVSGDGGLVKGLTIRTAKDDGQTAIVVRE